MLDFGALPPEVNSGRMYVGAGSGPMLAAAAAWDSLAADLQSASSSYGSTVGSLVAGAWTGPSSTAMAAAASPFVTWVSGAAAQAEAGRVAGQARRRRLRNRFRGHGAPARHRGQSRAVSSVGRH